MVILVKFRLEYGSRYQRYLTLPFNNPPPENNVNEEHTPTPKFGGPLEISSWSAVSSCRSNKYLGYNDIIQSYEKSYIRCGQTHVAPVTQNVGLPKCPSGSAFHP